MNNFNMWASGWCTFACILNIVNGYYGAATFIGILAIINLLIGVN